MTHQRSIVSGGPEAAGGCESLGSSKRRQRCSCMGFIMKIDRR